MTLTKEQTENLIGKLVKVSASYVNSYGVILPPDVFEGVFRTGKEVPVIWAMWSQISKEDAIHEYENIKSLPSAATYYLISSLKSIEILDN